MNYTKTLFALLLFGLAHQLPAAVVLEKEGTILSAGAYRFQIEAAGTASLQKCNDGSFRYQGNTMTVPVAAAERPMRIDGKAYDISHNFPSRENVQTVAATTLSLPFSGGMTLHLSGPMQITVKDERRFTEYDITGTRSLVIAPAQSQSKLDLKISEERPIFTHVNLNAHATGKLPLSFRSRPTGTYSVSNQQIAYSILFPDQATAAVIPEKQQTIPLQLPSGTAAIVLFHGLNPSFRGERAGELVIRYSDASSSSFEIVPGRDVSSWRDFQKGTNTHLAWSRADDSGATAFGISQFLLNPGKTPVSAEFRAEKGGKHWAIVGLAGVNRILTEDDLPQTILATPGHGWTKYDQAKDIIPGSILDFSRPQDAPSGKYGRVILNSNGHFVFEKEPQKRFRMVGVNLSQGGNFPSKNDAPMLAKRIAMHGYNIVRIHRQDVALTKNEKGQDGTELDPEMLDRLEFFIAELKKNGIYYTTDIYCYRQLHRNDNIPEAEQSNKKKAQMKTLIPISPSALDNWKKFARNWLTHRNPYTKLTLAEDPSLVFCQLVNEGNIDHRWDDFPTMQKIYRQRFADWRKTLNRPDSDSTADTQNPLFTAFLFQLQGEAIREQIRFLKEDLNVKAYITDCNMETSSYPLAHLKRDCFDLADAHGYFDHPRAPYGWGKGIATQGDNPLKLTFLPVFHDLARARLYGKPMTVTEWKFCPPNPFRSFGGAVMGAYSALQDWDGLFQYAWAHDQNTAVWMNGHAPFDSTNDPTALGSDRLVQFLFRRGDVTPGQHKFAYLVPKDLTKVPRQNPPPQVERMAALAQIGSVNEGSPVPAGVTVIPDAKMATETPFSQSELDKAWQEMEKGVARSDTGEILHNRNDGLMVVNTPKSEVICVSNAQQPPVTAGIMTVSSPSGPQTLAAIAMDDVPLRESKKILLMQLTNSANENASFERETLREWQMPSGLWKRVVVKTETAEIALALDGGTEKLLIQGVKADGTTTGNLPHQIKNKAVVFRLTPDALNTIYYILTR